jgi:site-specific recombinase XerD
MQDSETGRLGRPCGGGGQAKVLSPQEIARVDKCLTGTHTEARDRALLYLQYATGMRAGELAALDVGDVLHDGRCATSSGWAPTTPSTVGRAPSTWRAPRRSRRCSPTCVNASRT